MQQVQQRDEQAIRDEIDAYDREIDAQFGKWELLQDQLAELELKRRAEVVGVREREDRTPMLTRYSVYGEKPRILLSFARL
jgi:hypothetical protein